jgi:hypothetical protein
LWVLINKIFLLIIIILVYFINEKIMKHHHHNSQGITKYSSTGQIQFNFGSTFALSLFIYWILIIDRIVYSYLLIWEWTRLVGPLFRINKSNLNKTFQFYAPDPRVIGNTTFINRSMGQTWQWHSLKKQPDSNGRASPTWHLNQQVRARPTSQPNLTVDAFWFYGWDNCRS